MGKGTDKLYITHSEWASEDAFSASAGSGASKTNKAPAGARFKRLPFNFCAVSLQPFSHPVCTADGTIFDLTHILPWIKKHGTNPVDGSPLKAADLIKLHFAKNDDGEFVDPVTYKAFTNNTHLVALRNTGNVFTWDTIERLNIKAKNWHDLVSDEAFSRKDMVTIQDPQNLGARDLSSFKYIKDGESTLTDEQMRERNDPTRNVNAAATGSSAKVLKAKGAVARAREERAKADHANRTAVTRPANGAAHKGPRAALIKPSKPLAYNAAQHTTGQAAASFTSTGLTPHTSSERAILTEEEYMLHPRRVKDKGYARVQTTQGALNIELQTEFAPRAVWNFVQLAKRGYYDGVAFHRSIRSFMIQGGDPTGTGRGGQSVWGKPFADEWAQSPLRHDKRGVMSMANKGRDTNTSQFFVTYRAASHLDRKHTVFGRVIDEGEAGGESEATMKRLEAVETDESDRPEGKCEIEEVLIFVDPFEEFQKKHAEDEAKEAERAEVERQGGAEDDLMTWTGKRVRGVGQAADDEASTVGKYLDAKGNGGGGETAVNEVGLGDAEDEPRAKKRRGGGGGGFGNFDSW